VIASSPAYHDHPPQRLFLNVPHTIGWTKLAEGTSDEAAEEPGKPQPTTTVWVIGSMEWLAAQKKTS
jgi:hypothetical protein